jgi:hypothetical protein
VGWPICAARCERWGWRVPLTDDDLSALYRERTGLREDRRACPASETLARAAAGELESAERDAVVAHIESCHTCAEDFRIACGLQPEVGLQPAAGRLSTFWSWKLFPQAAAASLAILTAGLLAWNVKLQERTAGLETRLEQALRTPEASPGPASPAAAPAPPPLQAHVNVPIVDLEPPAQVRGEGSRRQIIRLEPNTSIVTLIVNTDAPRRAADYTLDLLDATGTTVWTGSGLRPGADATLSVALPAALLPPGDYVFSLAETNGQRVLHRYPITVISR